MTKQQLSLIKDSLVNAGLKQTRMARNLERPIGYFYRSPGARARSYIPQKYA